MMTDTCLAAYAEVLESAGITERRAGELLAEKQRNQQAGLKRGAVRQPLPDGPSDYAAALESRCNARCGNHCRTFGLC